MDAAPPPPAATHFQPAGAGASAAAPSKLYLAVHTVATATAKVPFAMILLLDFAKRKATPPGVVPSDGNSSMSLWDASDPEGLTEWLSDNLGGDCITVLQEVQEDFTYGLSLARMRATEKVADGGMKTIGALGETTSKAAGVLTAGVATAVGSTQQRLDEFDARTGVITSAKETTAAIANKALDVMAKAAEDRRVQSVVEGVNAGVSTGWAKLSSWVGDRMRDVHVADGSGEQYQQQYGGQAPRAGGGQAPQQQRQQQQAFSLSSADGGSSGGMAAAPSADRPLVLTDSLLVSAEPQAPAPAAAAPGAARAAATS